MTCRVVLRQNVLNTVGQHRSHTSRLGYRNVLSILLLAVFILVKVKVASAIDKYAEAQILNDVAAVPAASGLLLHFAWLLKYKRFALLKT